MCDIKHRGNGNNCGGRVSWQMNARVKALKRQLDEVEEEVQREKVGKRKAQRELEDLLETHETLARECTNLRNKLRYATIQSINRF